MATILAFKPASADRSAPSNEQATSSKAELIFFPGVRYERADLGATRAPQAAPQQSRNGSRRTRNHRPHDLIDLMD